MKTFFAILIACVAVSGCANLDPETRGGEWRPSGANALNLAAMAARPADLVAGRGQPGADGQEAAEAVIRLRSGHLRPLPDSGLAELQVQPSGTNTAGGN